MMMIRTVYKITPVENRFTKLVQIGRPFGTFLSNHLGQQSSARSTGFSPRRIRMERVKTGIDARIVS
jgi:hypothetical protein